MAVRNFNDAEKQKLVQIISQGSQVLGEVEDLKSGLREFIDWYSSYHRLWFYHEAEMKRKKYGLLALKGV